MLEMGQRDYKMASVAPLCFVLQLELVQTQAGWHILLRKTWTFENSLAYLALRLTMLPWQVTRLTDAPLVLFVCPYNNTFMVCPDSPKLCPKGSSNAGASNCTLCSAGKFTATTGSTSCQKCPGGHFCPAGTSSWARLNCGRGNYCPDGSGAPTPCPYQVPPSGGWGALQVQGPAFLVETAHCLNHCFWNFTSGDGMLSTC